MEENCGNTRRRGDVLIDSIYDATVKIIKEIGYANLTFQQIAQVAKTSRTVLYRRWTTTFDLIREIWVYKWTMALGGEFIDRIEDRGSLREDFMVLLTLYQSVYTEVGPEIMNAILFEIGQNNKRIAEIKMNATEKNSQAMRKLLGFAKARGEKIKEVSDITLTLPFELIRIKFMMGNDLANTEQLKLLVEEILLPVFKA